MSKINIRSLTIFLVILVKESQLIQMSFVQFYGKNLLSTFSSKEIPVNFYQFCHLVFNLIVIFTIGHSTYQVGRFYYSHFTDEEIKPHRVMCQLYNTFLLYLCPCFSLYILFCKAYLCLYVLLMQFIVYKSKIQLSLPLIQCFLTIFIFFMVA